MPERIQRRRTRGWRMPAGAVYVGRPSRWGNPFPVAYPSPFSRADAVRMYRDLIVNGEAWWTDLAGTEYESRHRFTHWHGKHPVPTIIDIAYALAGRDLACWCPLVDEHGERVPCHADVLLAICAELTHPEGATP